MPRQTGTISAVNLAQFIAEKTDRNLFLTGKAGTGKTVFLKEFKEHTKKKVVVLAPTGIAAINAHAQTIHSFFNFSFSPYIPQTIVINTQNDAETYDDEMLKELEMIIIDEISMARADLLDRIDNKLRQVRRINKPFGGVQLLLIGDLFQLPPVVTKTDKEILDGYYSGNNYFFNSEALKKVGFETIFLEKVYRQDDEEFVKMLDKARLGNLSWPIINKLNSRYMPDFEVDNDSNYITMVALKRDADKINNSRLERIDSNDKSYSASITGTFPEDAYPVPKNMSLKVGTQVMFAKNDYKRNFRNGTIGQISKLEGDSITVIADNQEIVVERDSWENIEYTLKEEIHQIHEEVVGTFRQFPIKPAWAITVHKSQGLTFDNAVIDLPHTFESGQAYVAFSRCRTLEGIVLKRKVNPSTFFVDKAIVDFYNRLETNIDKIAEKVSYVPFEWENDAEEDNVATIDSQLAEALKNWRLEKSRSMNVRAFQILTNRALNGVAMVKPRSLEQLSNINGVGLSTVSRFGEEIIRIVNGNSVEEQPVAGLSPSHQRISSSARSTQNLSGNQPRQKTWEITYNLFRSGMSVTEIANERGFTVDTIYNHLMRYVDSGELDAHLFVSEDVINKVRQFKLNNPESEGLKEIREALGEDVSYNEIRFALSCL